MREADSLQLAAALIAANHAPDDLEFVCFDGRLAAAAALEGFPVFQRNKRLMSVMGADCDTHSIEPNRQNQTGTREFESVVT